MHKTGAWLNTKTEDLRESQTKQTTRAGLTLKTGLTAPSGGIGLIGRWKYAQYGGILTFQHGERQHKNTS